MSEHTPGPWEVDEMLTINAPSTLMVAECSCAVSRPGWSGTDYSTRNHQEANARLIAAAPELLAAIKAILIQVNQGSVLERDACVAQARAAYREAVGE